MKIGKKSYLVGTIVLFISILSLNLFENTSQIKATENLPAEAGEVNPGLDPLQVTQTEEDLHNQETITVPEMEAYMDGRAYQAKATSNNGITGSMTEAEYKAQFSSLNEQQNTAWNEKYNFRPETNVVHVSTWAAFRAAFENNAVSKIVLDADIYYGTSIAIVRSESIEIDGQGHLLEMINGSINVDGLTSLAAFGKAFSDVPVFHMHDIQIANNTGYGALEGNLGNAWSFVNGRGQWGTGGSGASNRRLWRYRLGNVYTPYDKSKTNNNQRIGGRVIGASRAEISVWGYNTVVTGAENFYTGGMTFEPHTFYKGTNAYYNYSVIWFMDNTGNSGDTNSTGTRKFDVGEGSFVYLNYTASGTAYPAVYEFFDQIHIGKNATYNANMPGSASYFNVNNASFVAEDGSKVNLLSRAGNVPTVQFGAINGTNSGTVTNPSNTKYEFKPGSNVFIVGNNNGGVINYNSTAGGHQFILDNPEAFDIRNTFNSTTTTNAFLGDNTSNRGTNSFKILNSDISIWNNSAAIDGAPTYDYNNVGSFTVTNAVANGGITSSDSTLASQFLRPNFKRISGMNSTPVLTWTPVTDADYSQRGKVLIGFTAVGGSDPFDENGDAKVQAVYADATRKAYVDFTDTLGNTYTGVSTADNFIHWTKENHTTAGFQLAGQNMLGTPYRASLVNNVLTPYRMGEETQTQVLDVTPPEPAQVTGGKVTNSAKQLVGTNAEPKAKIYVEINGVRQAAVGSVNADGTWAYNLPRYLNIGDTVQLFLEDNAPKITETISPAPPVTNTETGNINPATSLTYRDATFEAATKYTVVDSLPDNPQMSKTVVSSGGATTQVGDTLTYTLTATNGKPTTIDTTWHDVVLTDTLPAGLTFKPETANVTINGVIVTASDYTYDESTRLLTLPVGNLNSGESAVVTFTTTVEQLAVGTIITNTGKASGFSPREIAPFIEGPNDPNRAHDEYSKTASVVNPGGEIYGVLELVSAPDVINFGATTFSPKGTTINNPSYEGEDLVVKDGRAVQEIWTLNAKLDEPLANVENPTEIIPNAIRYVHSNNEITLTGAAQPILSRKNEDANPYNVSGNWSPDGDGFKLIVPAGQSIVSGNYEATIVWELVAGPPPAP